MAAGTQSCSESCGRQRASLPRGSTARPCPAGASRVRTCVRVDQGEPPCEIPALVGDRSPVGRPPGGSRAATRGARRCARGAAADGARETSALRPRRHAVGRTAACRAPARSRGRSLRAHPRRTPTGRTRDAPAVRATTPGVTELAPQPSEARTRGRWRPAAALRIPVAVLLEARLRRAFGVLWGCWTCCAGRGERYARLYQATFRSGKRNACR